MRPRVEELIVRNSMDDQDLAWLWDYIRDIVERLRQILRGVPYGRQVTGLPETGVCSRLGLFVSEPRRLRRGWDGHDTQTPTTTAALQPHKNTFGSRMRQSV